MAYFSGPDALAATGSTGSNTHASVREPADLFGKAFQFVVEAILAAPGSPGAAAVGTGGTFAAGTYFWKIAAVGPTGESAASTEVSATLVLNGSATITWAAVTGATSYKIYRGTGTGAENVFYTVGNVLTFTDVNGTSTGGTPSATTPTVTFKVQGSQDNSNWSDIPYITATSNTSATTTIAATAVGATMIFLDAQSDIRFFQYFRLITTSNTNVTYRCELYGKSPN